MIKVTAMNQETKEVPFEDGMSVGDVLEAANINFSESDTVLLDGEKTDLAEELNDGALLVVTPKIKQG